MTFYVIHTHEQILPATWSLPLYEALLVASLKVPKQTAATTMHFIMEILVFMVYFKGKKKNLNIIWIIDGFGLYNRNIFLCFPDHNPNYSILVLAFCSRILSQSYCTQKIHFEVYSRSILLLNYMFFYTLPPLGIQTYKID